jgi:hypothetical protein
MDWTSQTDIRVIAPQRVARRLANDIQSFLERADCDRSNNAEAIEKHLRALRRGEYRECRAPPPKIASEEEEHEGGEDGEEEEEVPDICSVRCQNLQTPVRRTGSIMLWQVESIDGVMRFRDREAQGTDT